MIEVVFDPHVEWAIGTILAALLAVLVHIVISLPTRPKPPMPPGDYPVFPGF